MGSKRIFWIIFWTALTLNIYLMFTGINHNLLGYHSFRQTQTAITSYYFLEDGFRTDYETPVMGAPWAIPIEFPLYQWLAAGLNLFVPGLSLEVSGRIISIFFFYISLLFIYLITGIYVKETKFKLLLLSFILVNPLYIYWSRTFMIESTAFCLSAGFLWSVLFYNRKGSLVYAALALILGSAAGITKITTLFIFVVPALADVIYTNTGSLKKRKIQRNLLINLFVFILVAAFTLIWTFHAQYVRSLNPMAAKVFNREAFDAWNFGSIHQKVYVAAVFLLLFTLLHFLCRKMKYRWEIFVSLLAFASGPLVFTNLYLIHDYNYYANTLFLLGAAYFIIISMIENGGAGQKTARYIFVPLLILFSLAFYIYLYFPKQVREDHSLDRFASVIMNNTSKQGVLLIYGHDWDSTIPYFSGRRAVMDRYMLPVGSGIIKKLLSNMKGKSIEAMIAPVDMPLKGRFISSRVKYFGLNPEPVLSDKKYGNIFVKKVLKIN